MDEKIFEVEVRGLLNKEEYDKLVTFLNKNAEHKESDNKITDNFDIPNSSLKVVNSKDRESAKIAFKKGNIISVIAQEEFEVDILPSQYDDMVTLFTKLFAHLGYPVIYHVEQKRKNYWINGYEFAVKWTESFGYHYEAELIVYDESKIYQARKSLENYVKSLDLPIMNEDEFTALAKYVKENYSNYKKIANA